MTEKYLGLPAVDASSLGDPLWRKPSSSTRKYVARVTVDMETEMYEACRILAHDPRLPFDGNLSAMGRHFFEWGIESLRKFLDGGTDMMWRRLLAAQRRLTTEWYILKIDEQIEQQIEFLREWTAAEEWGAVYNDLRLIADDVSNYDRPEFKRRVARAWISNRGVKALLVRWDERMAEEEPETYHRIQEIFVFFEELARV